MATQDELTRRYKSATSANTAGVQPSTLPYTGGTAQPTTLPGTGTQAQATNKPYIIGSTAQTAAPSVVKPTQPVSAATVQPAATPTPAPATAAPAATGPDWAYIMNSVSDPYLKAIAEQQRNAKIDAQGLNYAKTNDYAKYLGGDFSTMSTDQLNALSSQLSGAWGAASPETRRQLHDYKSQVMSALDERNGTTSYYDPFTGTWTTERSTTEEKSDGPRTINLPTRNQNYDLTEYLRQQKAAEVEAALAGLKGAYEKSMAGYRDTASRIPEYYQNQKNQAAGASAVNQANFNEIAAAQGLNSGAFGQAALSRGNALAANLTALGQSQANAQKDVELQMAQLTAEYQSAIAKAQADGNAELARSLYNELVRVQNLVRSDYQYDVETAFRQAQFDADRADKAFNQDLQTQQWQASRDNAAKAAQDDATQQVINWFELGYDASGIPQELIAASGLTPEMLSYYNYLYNPNAAYTGAPGITSASGITGGYTGGGITGGGVTSGGGGWPSGYTAEQIAAVQRYLGGESAGLNPSLFGTWGPASQRALDALGMTFEEALAAVTGGGSGGSTGPYRTGNGWVQETPGGGRKSTADATTQTPTTVGGTAQAAPAGSASLYLNYATQIAQGWNKDAVANSIANDYESGKLTDQQANALLGMLS